MTLAGLVAISLLSTLSLAQGAAKPVGVPAGWHADFASARPVAKKENQPIFLVFR